jgi:hypothetical protein
MRKKSIPIDLLELNQLVLCFALQGQLPSWEQPSSPFLYSSWLWSQELQPLHLVVLEASTWIDLPLPVMLNKMCHSENSLHVDRIYPPSYVNKYAILLVFIMKSETGPQMPTILLSIIFL